MTIPIAHTHKARPKKKLNFVDFFFKIEEMKKKDLMSNLDEILRRLEALEGRHNPATHEKCVEKMLRQSEERLMTQHEDVSIGLSLVVVACVILSAWLLFQTLSRQWFQMMHHHMRIFAPEWEVVVQASRAILTPPAAAAAATSPPPATPSS